ncbi:hypothetical protein [Planobispora takensis]|uniref:Uncharacterized protein n=1 Tax=Planobispora takensis TaxID=1367882 RepID=A0A8J3SUV0_9ACTN|nr:hypothetical protein [Planobispora takensis]GIH99441.1 hypothetical protein Pta02_14500 [Planobispora takensis]
MSEIADRSDRLTGDFLAREAVVRIHERLRPHYAALQATEASGPRTAPPPGADPQTAFPYFTGRRP